MKHLIFLVCFLLLGCASIKRQHTQVITDTVIKIDTVIQVVHDTIPIIQRVRFTDTAYIENTTSVARSYYSTQQKRIVLELKGKIFDVPVSVYKHTLIKNTTYTKDVVKKPKYLVWFAIDVVLFIILLFIIKKYIL